MKTILAVLLLGAFTLSISHAVVRAPQETKPPRLVQNLFQFPLSISTQGIDEGFAELHFIVDEKGQASEFIVVEATNEAFVRAALTGLQRSRFAPAEVNGSPQAVRSLMRLHFRETGVRSYSGYDWIKHPMPHMPRLIKPVFKLCQLNELDEIPQLITEPEKVFPVDEENRLLSGSVRMEYYIDRNGQTRLALPLESAHPALIEAAIRSIAGMRYEVPRKGGTPMPVRVQQIFSFRETDNES
ncbi:MAG: energy transducer TonB [Opitutales bacterium]|nr:energy transducer TonB [Opitutales bacterium]